MRFKMILVAVGVGGLAALGALLPSPNAEPLTPALIAAAEKLFGLQFNEAKRDSMRGDLEEHRANYEKIRRVPLPNSVPPALAFNPVPVGMTFETQHRPPVWSAPAKIAVPVNLEDLAYAPVGELAELLRTRKVTSMQLTQMYLSRLKKYGPKLECMITLTEELALEQAQRADAEIAAGKYRGPLHGIPYGVKDLLATRGYKTTWGAVPFKDQVIDEDATVIKKLEAAGAVLVAKLTLGELAWGDVWFGGKTRNPWNLEQGSSGSSAGSAAATAAGLVAFALGSETWGSIVSPSTRCGVTGLRPTYGRVSRAGAMALSWSMDKLGPICRTVEDCALVFNAIYGPDGRDATVVDLPFNYNPKIDLGKLRIGYLKSAFEKDSTNRATNEATLAKLRELGAKLIPLELPDFPVDALTIILSAEAAAAFDELTRSGRDDLLVRQIRNAWPNVLRSARFIPAVEYIQANRVRHLVIQAMAEMMKSIDVYVAPSFDGNLLLTNLTGHPSVTLPNGFNDKGSPTSITFMGNLYGEALTLAVAKAYQDATDFHKKHPPLFP
ncbi:MAG: amidase [candidate division KSB1 bacterium]|nr:amidase [candidate division KSB1 bacterium]MDZ7274390.1 amidase [candidate division KSB1 bacterium]MDZ7284948.1 amidase [candidate division KSB1 bacterium]MDZ7297631.1 amidase [candidate division KSB1 bacterium]MDZ7306371.1 amidase [candidate division KSB1 bacterium]